MKRTLYPLIGLLVVACSQPTREELLAGEQARREQCQELLAKIESSKENLLVRATLQENYNHECLGRHYPPQVQ